MAARLVIAANVATPQLTITSEDILSLRTNLSSSIDGSEVAVDTCETTIQSSSNTEIGLFIPSEADSLTTSDDKLLYVVTNEQLVGRIPFGTEIRYYEGTALIGLWYLESVTRVGKENYQLSMVSAFGLLENVPHVGGIYTGKTVSVLLSEIIQGTFGYTADSAIRNWRVYGWLPYGTARESLHQLLLAMGLNIFKNANGTPRFGILSNANPITVPDAEVYLEGNVNYGSPATSIAVTEHQWVKAPGTQTQTIYSNLDGTPAAENTTIVFSEPCYDFSTTGTLSIAESGVNYVVLNGVGTLEGKKYTHTQRILRKYSGASSTKPREVTVNDAYLVNTMNSQNVANRVLSYHANAHTITGKMIWGSARPGNAIRVKNIFGEEETAIVSKMDLISSATVAASFEAAADYNPGESGNNYTRRAEFTTSGMWTKPYGVTALRFALVGGGQGGQSGGNGYTGERNGGSGGAGGVGGQPGHGGNIYIADIQVPIAELQFNVSPGIGGNGGHAPYETRSGVDIGISGSDPVDGAEGTNTIFWYEYRGRRYEYTSQSGATIDQGYSDVITGSVYGCTGLETGQAGAAGGGARNRGANVRYNGETWVGGQPGLSNGDDTGSAGGGGGGGAAVGNDGVDGWNAIKSNGFWYGGDGGKGADAQAQSAETSIPGAGGAGGHGSGGGGGGGSAASNLLSGSGGLPGVAGSGGRGAQGVAIFYY